MALLPVDGREPEDSGVRVNTTCVPVRVLPWAPAVVDRMPTVVGFSMEVEPSALKPRSLVAGHTQTNLSGQSVHRSGWGRTCPP